MRKKIEQNDLQISKEAATHLRVGIIRSTYNNEMTTNMERYCRDTLTKHGVQENNISTHTVPGSLEIPIVSQALAETKKYDVLIAFGLILKGDTYHFELVADVCAQACMDVALSQNIPIISEVLAVYSLEQAQERTGNNDYNKGIEAALAALHVTTTLAAIKEIRTH